MCCCYLASFRWLIIIIDADLYKLLYKFGSDLRTDLRKKVQFHFFPKKLNFSRQTKGSKSIHKTTLSGQFTQKFMTIHYMTPSIWLKLPSQINSQFLPNFFKRKESKMKVCSTVYSITYGYKTEFFWGADSTKD